MRKFSLDEAATLFWRKDMEKLKYRPESRHFSRAQDAIVWAFEKLSGHQRWSAFLRFDVDHAEARIPELKPTYQSIKPN